MDEIKKVREAQRKKYLRETWLPQITAKYQKIFDPKQKAANSINKFMINNYFHPVVNPEVLESTPGLFRIRVKLTTQNLNKPETKSNDPVDFVDHSTENIYDMMDDDFENTIDTTQLADTDIDLKDIMQESLKQFKEQHDEELSKIIEQSIQDNMSYDDILLNQALLESSTIPSDHVQNNEISKDSIQESQNILIDEDGFYICLDLRYYGPNPDQPIYYNDLPYYLSLNQMEKVKKLWNKIDPNTTTGTKYQQDQEYFKCLYQDNNK